MFSKHKLDAARIDFHNSFPPTRRSKTYERIEFPSGEYEVLHLSRKIISANLKIWCSKMQPLSGNQRPDLLTFLMNMSLVLRLPRKMHLCRSSSNVPRLPSFLEMLQNPHLLLTFEKVHNPLRLPGETTSERPKMLRTHQFFALLTSKRALRHNGVHFFDISTSKSGPSMVCFVHFDFEMCFVPQRRALFRQLNFRKWSKHGVFCTFWLRHVLRATTAGTFSTAQFPKVVQAWCVLYVLTSKYASRHNGVHFSILFRHVNFQKWSGAEVFCTFWLGNVLRATTACNFSSLIWPAGSAPAALASLLFDPPEPQIIGKTQRLATFLLFGAPGSSFFWDFLFFDLLSSVHFADSSHLCLSEDWLLNFLRWQYMT